MEVTSERSVEVFFSYAQKDERLMSELEKHLRIMQREGLIVGWHDNKINPGVEWERETNAHLNKAEIILLLVSPDFIDSEYCYSNQMQRALQRHEKGDALVIPVILRAVDWEHTPFGKLKVLPKNAKPVTRWRSRDDAFTDIAKGIRSVIKTFAKTQPTQSDKPPGEKIKKVFSCSNCKAPISLPMPCWKCGLLSMQICNECLEKNSPDRETCQKCEAPLVQVCNNCKTKNSFEAEFCRNCGLQLRLVCYECLEKNSLDREICQKCAVSLVQVCSHCREKNSLHAELCLRCGMPLIQICITCDALNEMEDDTCWRCNELLNIEYALEVPLHLAEIFSK